MYAIQLDTRKAPGSVAANQYGISAVKTGTDRQVKYATRLAAEKDTTGLNIPADFSTVNKRALSDWIDTLLARPDLPSTPGARPMGANLSDKQLAFLRKLIMEKDWKDLVNPSQYHDILMARDAELPVIDKRRASSLIDWLMTLRRVPTTTAVTLEDGMYLKDGVILKVYHTVHGANQQVAKRLRTEVIEAAKANDTLDELTAEDKWEYLGKRGLAGVTAEHRMSLEQAKELGAVYGVCVRCAATLTNEVSIEAAMGPVCRNKI